MGWSQWKKLTNGELGKVSDKSGVYKVRSVKEGEPRKIKRLIEVDEDGSNSSGTASIVAVLPLSIMRQWCATTIFVTMKNSPKRLWNFLAWKLKTKTRRLMRNSVF